MPTFIFVPRCLVCREPAAVVDEDKYLCGSCFLERTLQQRHEQQLEPERPALLTSRAS